MAKDWLLLLCLVALCARGADNPAYSSPTPEPTAEETLILELINRLRADPKGEIQRITPNIRRDLSASFGAIDFEMFEKEMSAFKPVAPLVFNLELLLAARRHSHYMALNDLNHDEDPAKPGFVGKDFPARCKAAGFSGFANAENVYRDSLGALESHIAFTVDPGTGKGGMYPNRGHRVNMLRWNLKEIGCGAVPHGQGKLAVTHNFGEREVPRRVGGVVFVDANGNGFYDLGEGLDGALITCSTGERTRTWSHGAYALDLASDSSLSLKAECAGQECTATEKPGRANIKFDFALSAERVNQHVDELLAVTQKITDRNSAAFRQAALALLIGTRKLPLSSGRRQRIEASTRQLSVELRQHQEAVLAALRGDDLKNFAATLEEKRKAYESTAASAWFDEAHLVATARQAVLEVLSTTRPQRLPRALAQRFEATARQMAHGDLRGLMLGLILELKTQSAK